MPSQEGLLTPSTIWLFGRVLADLRIDLRSLEEIPKGETSPVGDETDNMPPRICANNLLPEPIAGNDPRLARIYAFSFEANYYDLMCPTIFLVHGDGIAADGSETKADREERAFTRMPPEVGRTGLSKQLGSFSKGTKVWPYDRGDFTIRLDSDSGSFDTLLLMTELGKWDGPTQSGGHLRSCAHVRYAGALHVNAVLAGKKRRRDMRARRKRRAATRKSGV